MVKFVYPEGTVNWFVIAGVGLGLIMLQSNQVDCNRTRFNDMTGSSNLDKQKGKKACPFSGFGPPSWLRASLSL